MGALALLDPHQTQLCILPTDLDPWGELDEGRLQTLFDMARVPMTMRIGLDVAAAERGWTISIAGSTVSHRQRVALMEFVTCEARILGWDAQYCYIEQGLWREETCTTHMLMRYAFTGPEGLVRPADMVMALGYSPDSPALPAWVETWIAAEAARPHPLGDGAGRPWRSWGVPDVAPGTVPGDPMAGLGGFPSWMRG